MKTSRIGQNIILLKSTTSTNDIAWSHAAKSDSHGLCIIADHQTAGRGRRGRVWQSLPGQSILCSILVADADPSLLSLAAPLAVVDAVFDCYRLHSVIKWPNDILLDNKKLAGILLESRSIGRRTVSVVGIGINVCQTKSFFANIPLEAPAISLAIKLGRKPSRNKLLRCLFKHLEYWIDTAAQNPEKLLNGWKRHNRQIGSRIKLESDGKQYSGTCVGIDPVEGLIVHLDRGPVKIFPASQTTILKQPN